jgi:hypothetical protein
MHRSKERSLFEHLVGRVKQRRPGCWRVQHLAIRPVGQ